MIDCLRPNNRKIPSYPSSSGFAERACEAFILCFRFFLAIPPLYAGKRGHLNDLMLISTNEFVIESECTGPAKVIRAEDLLVIHGGR